MSRRHAGVRGGPDRERPGRWRWVVGAGALLLSAPVLARAQPTCGPIQPTDDGPVAHLPVCADGAPLVDTSGWPLEDEDTALQFFGDDRLWVMPGEGIARRVPAREQARLEASLGISAHGASATTVVKTSRGPAILFDVGRGQRRVLSAVHVYQLRELLAGMGVRRISHIHLTHAHEDHVNEFARMVRRYRIPARNVVIPGFMMPWARELRRQWDALAREAPSLGYAGTRPGTDILSLAPGGRYYTARFAHGDLVVQYRTAEGAVARLAAASRGERGSNASLVDAASALIRIHERGRPEAVMVAGDLRGRDILALRNAMEATSRGSFARFFSNVSVLRGISHHLGVIRQRADVQGIEALLRVTTLSGSRLEVLVQTSLGSEICAGATRQGRPRLVRALTLMGVDVTLSLTGTTEDASSATTTFSGRTRTSGPHVVRASPQAGVRQMMESISEMRAFHREIAGNAEMLRSVFGARYQRVLADSQTALANLDRLVDQRLDLSLGRVRGNVTEMDAVRFDEAALRRNAGRIVALGNGLRGSIQRAEMLPYVRSLSRARVTSREMSLEIERALQGGRASPRLWRLIELLQPEVRRQLRYQPPRRSALHAALKDELKRRRIVSGSAPGASTLPMGSRALVGFLAFLELAKFGATLNELHQGGVNAELTRRFDGLWWWLQRGVIPPFAGVKDEWGSQDTFYTEMDALYARLTAGDLRTITLSSSFSDAAWLQFLMWSEVNFRTFDDYVEHVFFAPTQTIRHTGGNFPEGQWEMLTFSWDPTANVNGSSEAWVAAAKLDTIMTQAGRRMIANTEKAITQSWARREPLRPRVSGPAFTAGPDAERAAAAGAHIAGLRPTGRARFAAGGDRRLYSTFDSGRAILGAGEWWDRDPYLLVFGNSTAPSGYVVVSGADYNTYGAIRAAKDRQYDPGEDVKIAPVRRDRWGFRMDRPADQQAAIDLAKTSPDVEFLSAGDDGEGWVRFWKERSNRTGLGLVKEDALQLDPQAAPPTAAEISATTAAGSDPASSSFSAPAPPPCKAHTAEPSRSSGAADDCGRIDCDCGNLEFGLLTEQYRSVCRSAEQELKIACEATGELQGTCHATASGPEAWPR